MLRETAAATPDAGPGSARTGPRGRGRRRARRRDRDGEETELRASLVVGADGRDSHLAELAGVKEKVLPHGRFAYGAYFEGPAPAPGRASTIWMLDPHWAAAFPTDSGLVFYPAMPTKDLLPEFRRDPAAALSAFVGGVPEALAVDPLFGIGCGWALQSAEWLADSVAPALSGAEPLQSGLDRYRRRHRKELRGHAFLVNDYATGRPISRVEKTLFAAAARDPKVATAFDELGTRRVKPGRMMAATLPRAIAVNTRHALGRRSGTAPPALLTV